MARVPSRPAMPTLVRSPHTVVRWDGDLIQVSADGAHRVLETADATVLTLVHAFARPRAPDEVLDELAAIGDRKSFADLIDRLVEAGALVDVEALPAPERADVVESADAEDEPKALRKQVKVLSTLLHWLARDLQAFGATWPASWRANDPDARPVRPDLAAMQRQLLALITDLSRARPAYIDEQLARLDLTRDARELKLHIGSGPRRLPSWINIDLPPAELALDLAWKLPFANGSTRYVFLSHCLEHLYYPDEALHLLKEVRRVLASGGILRVIVPDIEKCIRAYAEGDREFFTTRSRYWPWAAALTTPLEHFLQYAGAGVRPDAPVTAHKYGYDLETLRRLLERSGLVAIEASTFMTSRHPELRVDDASEIAGASWNERPYSLFVEATAPS